MFSGGIEKKWKLTQVSFVCVISHVSVFGLVGKALFIMYLFLWFNVTIIQHLLITFTLILIKLIMLLLLLLGKISDIIFLKKSLIVSSLGCGLYILSGWLHIILSSELTFKHQISEHQTSKHQRKPKFELNEDN